MRDLKQAVEELHAGIKEAHRVMKDGGGRIKKQETSICVLEKEGGKATVSLRYYGEWYIMFGKCQVRDVKLFEGDLKTACEVARKAKSEIIAKYNTNLKIYFIEFEEYPDDWIY